MWQQYANCVWFLNADAAKRRVLPAWIREGLEKMEREKQKKAEKERLDRELEEEKLRRNERQNSEVGLDGRPAKSKFVSYSSALL